MFATTPENDKSPRRKLVHYDCPVIIGYTYSSVSHNDICSRRWWLKGGHRDWVSVLEMYDNSEIEGYVMGVILLLIMWNFTGFTIHDSYRNDCTHLRCYVSTDVTFHFIDINRCALWKRTTIIKHPLKRKSDYIWWPLCCRWQWLCLSFLEWQPHPDRRTWAIMELIFLS